MAMAKGPAGVKQVASIECLSWFQSPKMDTSKVEMIAKRYPYIALGAVLQDSKSKEMARSLVDELRLSIIHFMNALDLSDTIYAELDKNASRPKGP